MKADHLFLRILLLADTHLGHDLPQRSSARFSPDRLRRGASFFANTRQSLALALRGEVDLVVHGGDLLFRSKVEAGLVARALEPFLQVAEAGVPVCLVPGNHERSRLPFPLFGLHPRLHIFHRPGHFDFDLRGMRLRVAGFPNVRGDIQARLRSQVAACGVTEGDADIRLLCMHQSVEGARVGPVDYAFSGADPAVIPRPALDELPVAAVLSGHIHRAQIIEGAPPVIYPGSVERCSPAERYETKGFWLLDFAGGGRGGKLTARKFVPLPTESAPVAWIDGLR